MIHGDGDIYLIYFENELDRFCYVIIQKDIAECVFFRNTIDMNKYWDWETPYGYGGPLSDGVITEKSQKKFLDELTDYCKKNNVISQFIRFHPLLKNYELLSNVIETRYLRDTIYIDTSSLELILTNMDSKNRNMVRKAKKNGIEIIKTGIEDFENFIPMYNETMKKNNANSYYFFSEKYFESLLRMRQNAIIFYALYNGEIISGAIMYYNDRYMHYHLSGSYIKYRELAPNNLLLYEAARWASLKGIKQFHLGGGIEANDSLFGFKKQFNKNGKLAFVVGRTIFNYDLYDDLLKVRKISDPEFDIANKFMIQYRR